MHSVEASKIQQMLNDFVASLTEEENVRNSVYPKIINYDYILYFLQNPLEHLLSTKRAVLPAALPAVRPQEVCRDPPSPQLTGRRLSALWVWHS